LYFSPMADRVRHRFKRCKYIPRESGAVVSKRIESASTSHGAVDLPEKIRIR